MLHKISTVIFLATIIAQTYADDEICPEVSEIQPCDCVATNPPILKCSDVDLGGILDMVFRRSSVRVFSEVHIINCTLQYLPLEMFNNFHTSALIITNTSLVSLFSGPAPLNDMKYLIVSDSRLLNLAWYDLRGMEILEILNFTNTKVVINGAFAAYVRKTKMEKLVFKNAQLRSMSSTAVFLKFKTVKLIDLSDNRIGRIDRLFFPDGPAITEINLGNNLLTTLPHTVFEKMPNLQQLHLQGNNLTSFTHDVFNGKLPSNVTIDLTDNSIPCDCGIYWMLKELEANTTFKGSCLRGDIKKPLMELKERDFYCPNRFE